MPRRPLTATNTRKKKALKNLARKIDQKRKAIKTERAPLLPLTPKSFDFSESITSRTPSRLKFLVSTRRRVQILIVALVVLAVLLIGLLVVFLKDLPSPNKLSGLSFPVSTKILDRKGRLLYEIYTDKNRTPISLSDLPDYVSQASIAIEDQHFYTHHGFDFGGITRALSNIVFRRRLQGGSTITQQLVKVTLLSPKRTIYRKIREAILTIATEVVYKKDRILEMYLNHIPYGGTAYGIESAAHTYFNKDAKNLSLAEATLLAGLPAAPSAYSPFGSHPDRARQRQVEVLRRMVEDKYITQEEADAALKEELKFATDSINIKAPHFVFYVKDLLSDKYSTQTIERGGLRVTTTLDLDLQDKAQASLSAEIDKLTRYKVGNGAAMVTNPKTGEILAMIGSRDYFNATQDGQVNVTIRERQPGSSIKPLNYVTAFETKKLTPGSMLLDVPTCFQVAGQPAYCPKNYDGTFRGPVQERFALGNSLNIHAVKTLAINTLDTFIATASAMGIRTWNDPSRYGLSLTLGGGEVTMLDMATAYGTLANQGVRVDLHPILKVEDYTGQVLETYDPEETLDEVEELTRRNGDPEPYNPDKTVQRVIHRAPAYLTSHILLDNNARSAAFGTNSELVVGNQVVSVKTGTTNDLRDNWTIGYTPEFLTAVWVGNNNNTPMNRSLVSGITGAAPIWNDIMREVLRGRKPVWPEKPSDVVGTSICTISGLLPDPNAPCPTRFEYFWQGTEPQTTDNAMPRDVWINPATGLPPKEGEPTEGLQTQPHILVSDPFAKDYCVDCVRALDDKGKTIFETYSFSIFQPKLRTQ